MAEPTRLSDTVVTASQTAVSLRDAPAAVTVISREELSSRPVQDLADALRGTTGLHLNGVGFTRRGISLRGMPSQHTLVLVDGKRISAARDVVAHADFELGWVPVEAIERIEVVRGPMSSLYGSEALGGVVNIITRRATDEWKGSALLSGSMLENNRGGAAHQAGVYAGGPLVADKLALTFQAEQRRRQATPNDDNPRISELEGRDGEHGSLTLTWTPDQQQRIDLGHARGRDTRWRNTAGSPAGFYEFRDIIDRTHSSLSHQGDWSFGQSRVRAYRSELERTNRRTQGEQASRPQKLTDDNIDASLTLPLFTGAHRLSLGGEWRHEQLEDGALTRSGKAEARQYALFVQDEWSPNDDWLVTLGVRMDRHEDFGWEASPRLYVVHHLDANWSVKAGVGKGFKAPSLTQLSPDFHTIGGGGRFDIYGNPDLKPETNTSQELGLSYHAERFEASINLFRNELEDLILTNCILRCAGGPPGGPLAVREYANLSEARIHGVELSGDWRINGQWGLAANYTYLDAEDRDQRRRLAERPRHAANLALNWIPRERWNLSARAEHTGNQLLYSSGAGGVSVTNKLPSYTLVSLLASHQLTGQLSLRGGIDNLTDKRLADESALFNYSESGRTLHVGLNYSF